MVGNEGDWVGWEFWELEIFKSFEEITEEGERGGVSMTAYVPDGIWRKSK